MKTATHTFALRQRRANVLTHLLRRLGDWTRIAEISLAPFLDLFIRLWLAQQFWVSGILKMADWDNALYLATHEYPVAWLDPVTSAYVGVAIEVIGPIFLVLGLATRIAALPLLILSLVIQFEYQALNEHLYWAALFGWYVMMGAGAFSLDRLVAPGLAASAVPLVVPLSRFYAVLTRYLGPVYKLAIRLWLAIMLFAPIMAGRLLGEWLLACASPFLALGLFTRFMALVTALGLLVMGFAAEVQELQRADYLYGFVLLALLTLRGPGILAMDTLLWRHLADIQRANWSDASFKDLPHVVIVGAGFGGLQAVYSLRLAACRITVIDKRNYHLFQPLLYQVATASLSPADIATPIRALFRDQTNARVLMGEVVAVDNATRQITVSDNGLIDYDYLVLATGARHSYFGHDEWEPFAPGLKRIDDAIAIRRRLLMAFEQAENATESAERERLQTFVIVGGGPTGVELAGAIAELAQQGLAGEFRNVDPSQSRVLLIQSAPRLLMPFPEKLSAISERSLRELGVEVLTNSRVEQIDEQSVVVSGRRIPAGTMFWAAGVVASPAAKWIDTEADRAGRIKVELDLSVPNQENVFAIGDTALSEAWNGKPVPGLAPAAKQQGAYVAGVIQARLEGRKPPAPFRYHHLGNLATIGRKSAVVDFGFIRFSGGLAWWLWGLAHIFFLVEVRKRLTVAIEWFWAYLTYKRGTRLITGGHE